MNVVLQAPGDVDQITLFQNQVEPDGSTPNRNIGITGNALGVFGYVGMRGFIKRAID